MTLKRVLPVASTLLSLTLLGGSAGLRAQSARSIPWQRIVNMTGPQQLPAETLSAVQRHDLEQAIVASHTVWDDCEDDTEWPHQIQVHRLNLGPGHYTLAEAGPGCARAGQGANGAMWLLRWDAGTPTVIGNIDGWLKTVLPETSNGLHDVAIGWHMSASEYGLTLYRFNGKRYRLVDGTNVQCSNGTAGCIAAPSGSRPQSAGAVATPTKESAQP